MGPRDHLGTLLFGVVPPSGVLHIVYPSLIVDPRRKGRLPSSPPSHALVPDAHPRRLPLLVLAFVVGLLATLSLAGPAAAATKSCADDVVADWYGDGRVDKVFPLECYREAIRSLPVDVLDYSNAKQDILRALAFARKGTADPGPSGAPQPTAGGGTDGTAEPGEAQNPGEDPADPGQPTHPGDEGTDTNASGAVDTSGPSSLPIPLLILGGLALLLLAAGAAGYINRRAHSRRDGGPPGTA